MSLQQGVILLQVDDREVVELVKANPQLIAEASLVHPTKGNDLAAQRVEGLLRHNLQDYPIR